LVTEKATELGATSICPIYLKNCDVKEGSGKLARLSRIAISATKQCGRSKPLNVLDCINAKNLGEVLKDFELVILANEREDNKKFIDVLVENKQAKSIAIIIGPEGGFTSEEIELIVSLGGKSVSLGKRILRTETAGLYMLSVINEIFDN
jgi:16S rRNA (uracil1498-N3)-methyltransferase